MKEFDLFVIGAGSGGVRVARWSAVLGAKVGIVECDRPGGTCVIRGCIPKKMMSYASNYHQEMIKAQEYGWDLTIGDFSWNDFRLKREKEISRLSQLYQGILDKNKVQSFSGEGFFLDSNTLQIGNEKISAKKFVIATGSRPVMPQFLGHELLLDSNQVFNLEHKPQSIVILGAGYIALEFASILNGLGVEVHVVFRKNIILSSFDQECAQFLQNEMIKKGIHFYQEDDIQKITKKSANILTTTIASGKILETTHALAAIGRIPHTASLQLASAGVKVNKKGAIEVDHNWRTSIDHIYAIGDCIDQINLTPIATAQGTMLAEKLFAPQMNRDFNFTQVPSAIFTHPPLSTVGLTEEEARKKYIKIQVFWTDFRPLELTLTSQLARTAMKLIVDQASDKVVGLHMVGEYAPEIVQGFAVAMTAGATKKQFDQTIGIHPTSAEEFVTLRTAR